MVLWSIASAASRSTRSCWRASLPGAFLAIGVTVHTSPFAFRSVAPFGDLAPSRPRRGLFTLHNGIAGRGGMFAGMKTSGMPPRSARSWWRHPLVPKTGYRFRPLSIPKTLTDDMSRRVATDSEDDQRPPGSDPARSAGSGSEAQTGLAPLKRNAPWLVPFLLGLLVFLFGENVTSRFDPPEAPSDGDTDLSLGSDREGRIHATYSLRQAPFVHPEIVGDLVGWLSDTGDQVVAINLLDSQDSDRYFGDISVVPLTDPPVPSWPWVYALEGEPRRRLSNLKQKGHAYRYVGSTPSGLDVLHYRYSGGGSGLFNHLVFVHIEADYGVDYERPAGGGQRAVGPLVRRRELIRLVGKIPLGDRWLGTVEVVGNDVVARGRNVDERCDAGGLDPLEAYEMRRLWRMDCKDGEPDDPPLAQVFTAPERQ